MSKINRGQIHAATSVSLLSLWYCPHLNAYFQRRHIFCNIFTVNILYLIRLNVWLDMLFNIAQEKNFVLYINQGILLSSSSVEPFTITFGYAFLSRFFFVLADLKCMKNRLCSFRRRLFWHLPIWSQRNNFDFRMALKQFKCGKQIVLLLQFTSNVHFHHDSCFETKCLFEIFKVKITSNLFLIIFWSNEEVV